MHLRNGALLAQLMRLQQRLITYLATSSVQHGLSRGRGPTTPFSPNVSAERLLEGIPRDFTIFEQCQGFMYLKLKAGMPLHIALILL